MAAAGAEAGGPLMVGPAGAVGRTAGATSGAGRGAGSSGSGAIVSVGAGAGGAPIVLITASMCSVSNVEVRKKSTKAGPRRAVLL